MDEHDDKSDDRAQDNNEEEECRKTKLIKYENKYEEDEENFKMLIQTHNIVPFEVKSIKCMSGSNKGDNYMSVVKRIVISDCEDEDDYRTASYQFSIIIKRQIEGISRRALYRCNEAFQNEINAYKHVVPFLTQYLSEPFFPKCYFAGEDKYGEIVMLEDLKQSGFILENRIYGINLDTCELVLKELANLHAASVIAKQLNNELFEEKRKQIEEIVYCDEAKSAFTTIFNSAIDDTLKSLEQSNVDGCLTKSIQAITTIRDSLFDMVRGYINNSNENLSVMCHGDLWMNNIMFKLATIEGDDGTPLSFAPCEAMFFDLQAMRYASPVFDILHFIYTSTRRELRETQMNHLLTMYSETLLANVERHITNIEPEQLESLRMLFSTYNLAKDYYKNIYYGLAVSMWILPAVTFDSHNIPNLDEISEQKKSDSNINITKLLTPEYHNRIKDLALEFYENGYFNLVLKE